MKKLFKISYFELLLKAWKLASKSFSTESRKNRIKQQWKSFFGVFINPLFAKKWFTILESFDLTFVSQYRPRLFIKPFRVYMSIKWTNDQKIKVIQDTYRLLSNKNNIFKQIMTQKNGIELVRFNLSDKHEGVLTLGYDERFRKEGELVCTFECNELGGKLVSGAFSFEEFKKEKWICRIGCVQGYKNDYDNAFKDVQKQMYGLRPKSLMVYVIQEISRQIGCVETFGASDSIQAYSRKHLIYIPRKHSINFDYDAIWTESEGKINEQGWYKLPLIPARKSYDQIKPNKRSLYNKRFAFLDIISKEISTHLGN